MRRKFRFRPTLITLVTTVVVLCALGVGAPAYLTSQHAVDDLWDDLSHQIARTATEQTLRYLEPALPEMDTVRRLTRARVIDPGVEPPERTMALLLATLRGHPNFGWVSFGDVNGVFLSAHRFSDGSVEVTHREQVAGGRTRWLDYHAEDDGALTLTRDRPDAHYDPRERPWYRAALAKNAGVWIDPYLFASTHDPGFMYAAPLPGPDGSVRGVFAVEFEALLLSRYLHTLDAGRGERVYVVTTGGLLAGHPDGVMTVRRNGESAIANAQDHPDPVLRAAFRAWRAGGGGARAFEVGELLGVAEPFPPASGLDWVVLVTVPRATLMGDVYRQARIASLVALAVAVLAALVGVVFATRVSRALEGLSSEFELVGRFDLSPRPLGALASRVREVFDIGTATDRMKSSLRSFGKYVPRDVVSDLLATGVEARLGGRRVEVTTLFADLAGFTSLAETLEPDELVSELAECFTRLGDAVHAHGGTLDKYIGDCVMAFWGAPRPAEDHALRACRAALAMRDAIDALPPAAGTRLRVRVGVNTGEVVVGNVGSPERLNYTVMGDAVNVASRLEGLNKEYGSTVLLGPETADAVRGALVLRALDYVAVKGRAGAQPVYELLGERGAVSPEVERVARAYEHALERYRARQFEEAAMEFEALGSDPAARVLAARSRAYALAPPPDEWEGEYIATRK